MLDGAEYIIIQTSHYICDILGLVLNSVSIFELTAEGDPRVGIDGDVELEITPIRHHIVRYLLYNHTH